MTEPSTALQPWLDRLRGGDPDARDELIRRCQERLRLLTRQMLGRYPGVHAWENTSDVFNAALLRLAAALDDPAVRERLQTPRDLYRLGATQVRRELIDLARSLRGPRGLATNQIAPGNADTVPVAVGPECDDPYRITAWLELHRRVDEELDPDERELLDLLYYQGQSQPEAAAVLGLALRTLKRRWQQLRLKVRASLGDDWPL